MSRDEDALQRNVVKLLSYYEAQGKILYFAVPNEGKRSFKSAQHRKNLGLRAGIPDLVIIIDGKFHGLELKSEKGRLNPNQRAWQEAFKKRDIPYAVCRRLDDVKAQIDEWIAK